MTTAFDREPLEVAIFLEESILRWKTFLKTDLLLNSKIMKHKNIHALMTGNSVILLKNIGKRLELPFQSELSILDLHVAVISEIIIHSKVQFICWNVLGYFLSNSITQQVIEMGTGE